MRSGKDKLVCHRSASFTTPQIWGLALYRVNIGRPKQKPRSVTAVRVHPNFALGNGGEGSDIEILMLNSSDDEENYSTDAVWPICMSRADGDSFTPKPSVQAGYFCARLTFLSRW